MVWNRAIVALASIFSKTAGLKHRSLFYDTVTTLTPFLMLTLGLSITLRQFVRLKYYTNTIFRLKLKVSVSKGLGYSSIGKTMTRSAKQYSHNVSFHLGV